MKSHGSVRFAQNLTILRVSLPLDDEIFQHSRVIVRFSVLDFGVVFPALPYWSLGRLPKSKLHFHGVMAMIKLTRLDGQPFVLNADLIRYVEKRPDTFITLVSGERIVVGETMEAVVELAVEYQQRKHLLPATFIRQADA